MAVSVAQRLGVKPTTIKRVLRTFAGLPDRQQEIAVIRGVRYVNDTTATTPDATIAALRTFAPSSQRIHLIFGGNDKELVFDEVARLIRRTRTKVYLLPGTAHNKIVTSLQAAKVGWCEMKDMKTAMQSIRERVRSGQVVLLSPGCTSFGQFKNEFHRGQRFARMVRGLAKV
jgi:UDP-N-acetylmuramoylalanine--D-glutamate ligase